jgi:hypothetical protein
MLEIIYLNVINNMLAIDQLVGTNIIQCKNPKSTVEGLRLPTYINLNPSFMPNFEMHERRTKEMIVMSMAQLINCNDSMKHYYYQLIARYQ